MNRYAVVTTCLSVRNTRLDAGTCFRVVGLARRPVMARIASPVRDRQPSDPRRFL